jgi:hypothetical protein
MPCRNYNLLWIYDGAYRSLSLSQAASNQGAKWKFYAGRPRAPENKGKVTGIITVTEINVLCVTLKNIHVFLLGSCLRHISYAWA